jgi:hypothetical protein
MVWAYMTIEPINPNGTQNGVGSTVTATRRCCTLHCLFPDAQLDELAPDSQSGRMHIRCRNACRAENCTTADR